MKSKYSNNQQLLQQLATNKNSNKMNTTNGQCKNICDNYPECKPCGENENALKEAIDAEYTTEITCPHCGYVSGDSWEMPEVSEEEWCPECDGKYKYEREIEVTYTSTKL